MLNYTVAVYFLVPLAKIIKLFHGLFYSVYWLLLTRSILRKFKLIFFWCLKNAKRLRAGDTELKYRLEARQRKLFVVFIDRCLFIL